MKYLKIKNDGLLDIRLVQLMGGTTKADDKFKIGQFGTGLKYTLAYLVRNNLDFKIFIGGKEIKITTIIENIRDTDFEIICINGEKTSITSNMGYEWEGWMIIRELWCNALDEENSFKEITEEIEPEKNTTEFYIQYAGDIMKVYDNWNTLFVHDQTPLMENENFAIYPGGEKLRCYKNGVLIKSQKVKSVFSYDIKDAMLNELREMQDSISNKVSAIIPQFNKECVDIFLNNIKDTFEETMDYDWYHGTEYCQGWKEAIGNAKVVDYETYEKIVDRIPEIENQAIVQVPKMLFKKLISQFPSISLLRASDKLNEFFETYSDSFQDKIRTCLNILEKVGYFIDPELKILTGIFGNKRILGQVCLDSKEIHLSQDLEVKSNSELIVTLIEENEHYKTGFGDCTREFQTHFIELYSNILLKNVNVLI